MLLLLAVACGVAVGNVYFPQAISPLVAADLRVSADSAALAVTATQLGYAAGLFLLVPLVDRLRNRRLVVTLFALTCVSLLGASAAPTLAVLMVAGVLVGLTTVVSPIIGSIAVGLVADDRRGSVSGTLLSGSIGGILLARVVAGPLGEAFGWRAPYVASALLAALIAIVLARQMPEITPPSRQRYSAILGEPLKLLLSEPVLRRSCLYQACVFAGFSAVWTSLPQLLPVSTVAALGLISAATMVVTPIAGRMIDRRGPDSVNLVCLVGTVVSAGVLAFGVAGGVVGLVAATLGVLLLDVTMQSGMVANVTRVYTVRPDSRGRLNTAYMTCSYIGGSVGSWLGAQLCTAFGWTAVSALVAVTAGIALTRHFIARTAASSMVSSSSST